MDVKRRRMVVAVLAAVLVVASGLLVWNSGVLNSGQYSASITDASGNNITMSKVPERIVSCAPGLTEVVCALGLQDKLVGVTDYDDYPAEVPKMVADGRAVSIGGFWTPNFEKIVAARPDVVFLNSGTPPHVDLAKQLKEAGITAVMLYPGDSIDQVYKSIVLVGKVTNKEAVANQKISEMQTKIGVIGSKVAAEATRPNVLYISYAEKNFQNLYTTANDSAISQIIGMAGGKNLFADLTGDWFSPSPEVLINRALQIDAIVITPMYSPETPENMSAFLSSDPVWKNTPAVVNNKVYYLMGQAENTFNRQSVRMVDAVQLMAEMLHPDAFSTKVPYNQTGPNVIGDEYANYLTQGTSSHTSSQNLQLAVCSRE